MHFQVSLGMKPSLFADGSGEESEDTGVQLPDALTSVRVEVDSSSEQDDAEVSVLMRREVSMVEQPGGSVSQAFLTFPKPEHPNVQSISFLETDEPNT